MEMCTIDEFTNKQFIALVRSKSEGDRNKTKLLRTRPEKVIQPLRKFAVKKYGTAIFLDNKIFRTKFVVYQNICSSQLERDLEKKYCCFFY